MMQLPKINKDFNGHYVIPEGVTAIEGYAFAKFTALKSIEIPNSVTNIADDTFCDCVNLASITVAPDNPKYCSENNVLYNKDKTKIIYCARGKQEQYEIPNSVTKIGFQAFKNCSFLKSIIIPSSVIEIEDGVLTGCTNLISITVASDNPKYCAEDNVLYNKDKTELIGCIVNKHGLFEIPNSVTKIGNCAFWKCIGITNINSPNSVTEIGDWAFRDCAGLISIEISNSVTKIGHCAFSECKNLMSIEIPNSMIEIGDFAFEGCTCIKDIKIPNSVTKIGDFAFTNCTSLTSIKIPNSVTRIGDHAFFNCKNLEKLSVDIDNPNYCSDNNVLFNKDKSILIYCVGGKYGEYVIPNSVTKLEDYAFSCCTGLISIVLPNSNIKIESSVFEGCKNLSEIHLLNEDPDAYEVTFNKKDIKDITLYVPIGTKSVYCHHPVFSNFKNVKEESQILNKINKNFKGHYVVLNGVTEIGRRAFESCTGLTSIEIPQSVIKIGRGAFYECSNLTHIELPTSVCIIENYAFFNCKNLTSLEIPRHVVKIGDGAFWGCTKLIKLNVVPDNPCYCSENNILFSKDKTKIIYCARGKQGSYKIPITVKEIGNDAFSGCIGLTNIEMPNSVKMIGNAAFSGCTNLKNIVIPNSVTEIGNCAFEGCTSLTTIEIPKSVRKIGAWDFHRYGDYLIPRIDEMGEFAFSGCESLMSLTVSSDNPYYCSENNVIFDKNKEYLLCYGGIKQEIYEIPNSVIAIVGDAFRFCASLKNIVIPNSVTFIGEAAFYECTGISSLTMPDSVTFIGEKAFSGCTGITSLTISESTEEIGEFAFNGCVGLTSIVIPSSVIEIGDNAFYGCTNLTEIHFCNDVPNAILVNFHEEDVRNITLYVPNGCEQTYRQHPEFSKFKEVKIECYKEQ